MKIKPLLRWKIVFQRSYVFKIALIILIAWLRGVLKILKKKTSVGLIFGGKRPIHVLIKSSYMGIFLNTEQIPKFKLSSIIQKCVDRFLWFFLELTRIGTQGRGQRSKLNMWILYRFFCLDTNFYENTDFLQKYIF